MAGTTGTRSRTLLIAVLVAVVALLAVVASTGPAVAGSIVAFAKQAGNANTVNGIGASKRPRAGMLLPLDASGRFPGAIVPPGATGATGPAGTPGAPGTKGDQGSQGGTGDKGAPGAAGAAGPGGPVGTKGDTGDIGATGPIGPTGTTGGVGPAGATGAAGSAGAKGDAGETGPAGATGAAGSAGAKGDIGETGPAGATGAAGPAGAKGDTGAQGEQGLQGTAGPQGPAGPQGTTGPQGPAGGVVYPALVDINPVPRATASHLWDGVYVTENVWNNAYRRSFPAGDATSYLEWRLPIAAGTWDISVTYVTAPDAGMMTFSIDGSDAGSVDGYAATIGYNVGGEIPNVTVATSGLHTIRVRTETKNVDSTGYFGYLVWIRLVQH